MNKPQQLEAKLTDLEKANEPKPNSVPPDSVSGIASTKDSKPNNELSAEEQMALYEKELKENDWGHQPC
jgi:hypothetical protein